MSLQRLYKAPHHRSEDFRFEYETFKVVRTNFSLRGARRRKEKGTKMDEGEGESLSEESREREKIRWLIFL